VIRGSKLLAVLSSLLVLTSGAAKAAIPRPYGIYVLDDVANDRNAAKVYATGLDTCQAYRDDVAGDAIFVPIAKILPSITTWGQFDWQWGYLDTLTTFALSHHKKFSIELESGFHSTSSTYLRALPTNFAATCDTGCAPLFNVWVVGGNTGGACTSAFIYLPWVPKVQQFWTLAADSLAAHLHNTGVYDSLTLVHVPGLSVYDEEIRLPSGAPGPTSADTSHCPDGRLAYPTAIDDASQERWTLYGYSDANVLSGFQTIVTAFAQAFPDRYLGLSLFPPGAGGNDFPNFTADSVGYLASQIVKEANLAAPGRIEIQGDNLDSDQILPEVKSLAAQYGDVVGWQSNKHGGTGAGCAGGGAGTCGPDVPGGPFVQLLENGEQNRGAYVEVWSNDVVSYPASFAAAHGLGLYSTTDVAPGGGARSLWLDPAAPNPTREGIRIRFGLAEPGWVEAVVADVSGRIVRSLAPASMTAGGHELTWDGRDDWGRRLAPGIYFVRVRAGSFSATQTVVRFP